MWAQISLRAWVRGISGAPTKASISGETRRGFMMPRGSRFPVTGLGEAVAKVTVRTVRKWTGENWPGFPEEDGLRNDDAVSGERKVVAKTPEDTAIFPFFCFISFFLNWQLRTKGFVLSFLSCFLLCILWSEWGWKDKLARVCVCDREGILPAFYISQIRCSKRFVSFTRCR